MYLYLTVSSISKSSICILFMLYVLQKGNYYERRDSSALGAIEHGIRRAASSPKRIYPPKTW